MPDVGSMALAMLGAPAEVRGADQETKISEKLTGKLGRTLTLQPGKSEVVNFVIAWHFPHVKPMIPGHPEEYHDRQYKRQFADAAAVAAHVAEHFSRLSSQTRMWRDTWYLAACGFEYDGPKKHLGFAPRLAPENFKAAFTSAGGWGTFSQKTNGGTMEAKVAVKHGKVPLKTLALATTATMVTASLAGKPVPATVATTDGRAIVSLDVTIESGQELVLNLS